MSVKENPAFPECSASTVLAPTDVVPAPKACWEMGQHVLVSVGELCVLYHACVILIIIFHNDGCSDK